MIAVDDAYSTTVDTTLTVTAPVCSSTTPSARTATTFRSPSRLPSERSPCSRTDHSATSPIRVRRSGQLPLRSLGLRPRHVHRRRSGHGDCAIDVTEAPPRRPRRSPSTRRRQSAPDTATTTMPPGSTTTSMPSDVTTTTSAGGAPTSTVYGPVPRHHHRRRPRAGCGSPRSTPVEPCRRGRTGRGPVKSGRPAGRRRRRDPPAHPPTSCRSTSSWSRQGGAAVEVFRTTSAVRRTLPTDRLPVHLHRAVEHRRAVGVRPDNDGTVNGRRRRLRVR